MNPMLIFDQIPESSERSPLAEQDATKGLRLLLNRCVSFSLNSSPNLKRNRSNLLGNPNLKDDFTQHVGSQVQYRKKIIDKNILDTFIKTEDQEIESSSSPKSANKNNLSNIQNGFLGKTDKEDKRKKSTGKMYVNELWSKKHYKSVVNTSQLAKQQEELSRRNFQTTEEKVNEVHEIYKMKQGQKQFQEKYLLDKYQNKEPITQEDLSLKSDLDYQKLTSLKVPTQRRPKLSISRSHIRLLRKSNVEDISLPIKEEGDVEAKIEPETEKIRNKKKRLNTITLPSLDKSSAKNTETEARQILSMQSASLNVSPELFAINSKSNKRHNNKMRIRSQYSGDFDSELLPYSSKHPTFLLPPSERASKCMFSFQNLDASSPTNKNDPRESPIYESKVSLLNLVQNCKQFHDDKSAMKLVEDISYNFGPNKPLKDAKDQKQKREKLRKKTLLEACVYTHQERKKKEKSLGG